MLLVLLAALMGPFASTGIELDPATPVDETGGRAFLDLTVIDVGVGNATTSAQSWDQPDGTTVDYMLRNVMYEVRVTFKNAGTGISTVDAVGTLDIVHPIGHVMQSWSFNLSLAGGQAREELVEWAPSAAHSIADENGTLSGGLIFRGTIATAIAGTGDDESNNEYEEQIPVALWHDSMEGTVGTYNIPTWAAVTYTSRSPSNLYGTSNWRTDNSSSAAGNKHWRVSAPGSDYASNTDEMLKFGWWVPGGSGCEDPGHGLGYGQFDTDVQTVHGWSFCAAFINNFDWMTFQWVTEAWGSMGAGDELAMEALRSFNSIEANNLTEAGLSNTAGEWTRVVWDMSDVHRDNAYEIAYTKIADPSLASEGIHIDDFVLLGVEKVAEYTVTLDCDDPLPNAYVVIPADPNPPSLRCELTNNGYRKAGMSLYTEVSNATWMNNFPLRIDSANILDHDNMVSLPELDGGEMTVFWINLSVPEGSNVESLNWTVRLTDGFSSDVKVEMIIPVSVSSSFSVRINQVTPSYPALTLLPGETGDVLMRVKNTGNQLADWNLGAYFDSTLWGVSNLGWFEDWDEDGNETEITLMSLNKGEDLEVIARFTAPDQIPPGYVEVSLVASGVAPANAQSVDRVTINVPSMQDVSVTAVEDTIVAEANGFTRTMAITVRNLGNSPEVFDLSLDADWHIDAALNTQVTEQVDPFGGETTVMVIMPMPMGLLPSYYPITVIATSQTDSSLQGSGQFTLEVSTTYLIDVEDKDMAGQQFRGGDEPKTLNFEVTNNGNEVDAFSIELELDSDVVASITGGISDGRSVYIEPGTSTNITVEYAFVAGSAGSKTLTLSATSVEGLDAGQTVTENGEAVFQVGSFGWLNLQAGETIHITEAGTHTMTVTVHNRHSTNTQFCEPRIDASSDIDFQIRVAQSDRSFVLEPDLTRTITIEITLTDTHLANLPDKTNEFSYVLKVDADDDVAEATLNFKVDQYIESETAAQAEDEGWLQNIVLWIMGIVAILTLGLVLAKVLISTEHEDEISTLGGYESSLGLPEAPTLPDAPSLPSADSTANSMYGGTQEIFQQPVLATPPPPSVPEADPVATPEPAPAAPSQGPPVPSTGLPEGWSMEQWAHYGEEYLRRQGGA
jgi:uncharacterized membrane protein